MALSFSTQAKKHESVFSKMHKVKKKRRPKTVLRQFHFFCTGKPEIVLNFRSL